jgi:hypothetical protein
MFKLTILVVAVLAIAGALFAQTPEPVPVELPAVLLTILGFLAPVVYQFVTRYFKTELLRFLAALLLSALTGMLAVMLGKYPINMTPEFITILFTLSSLAYKAVWKPLFNATGVLAAPPTSYGR